MADFSYSGYGWLVVEWPESDEEAAHFEVYRDDLPWHWKHDYEDAR